MSIAPHLKQTSGRAGWPFERIWPPSIGLLLPYSLGMMLALTGLLTIGLPALAQASAVEPQSPIEVVTAMVHNEKQARQHRTYFRYTSVERSARTGGHLWKENVVETPDGLYCGEWLPKMASPSPRSGPLPKIAASPALAANPDALRAEDADRRADEARMGGILDILPKAFLYAEDGVEGECMRIAFRPNPAFTPSNYDERIVHGLAGTILVRMPAERLCGIEGHLLDRVSFGFGILGHIEKDSHFQVIRRPVTNTDWKNSKIEVHVEGKILTAQKHLARRGRPSFRRRAAAAASVTRAGRGAHLASKPMKHLSSFARRCSCAAIRVAGLMLLAGSLSSSGLAQSAADAGANSGCRRGLAGAWVDPYPRSPFPRRCRCASRSRRRSRSRPGSRFAASSSSRSMVRTGCRCPPAPRPRASFGYSRGRPQYPREREARWRLRPLRVPVIRVTQLVLSSGAALPVDAVGSMRDVATISLAAHPPPSSISGRAKAMIHQQIQQARDLVHNPHKGDLAKQLLYSQLPYHPQRVWAGSQFDAVLREPLRLPVASAVPPIPPADAVDLTSGSMQARPTAGISSASSKKGDPVSAVLVKPFCNSIGRLMLPAGTSLSGVVLQARPARSFARNGRRRFSFRSVGASGASDAGQHIESGLSSIQGQKGQNVSIDEEGGTRAQPDKGRFLAPLVLAMMAAASNDNDGGIGRQGVTSNGFGLASRIVTMATASREASTGFAVFAFGKSIYRRYIARGHQVSFPAKPSYRSI